MKVFNRTRERQQQRGAQIRKSVHSIQQATGWHIVSHHLCFVRSCFDDPAAATVRAKFENLTQIPDAHSEYLQLLRYEVGQFYGVHHDFSEYDTWRPIGPRILTVFLYLNDVEAGGGTNFPRLGDTEAGGLTVLPKQGRVLVWPSVMAEDPHTMDPRTHHQALPVEAGIKYSANGWIHLRDFKTPYATGCA
jgi:prolyl 4-hydroxylase